MMIDEFNVYPVDVSSIHTFSITSWIRRMQDFRFAYNFARERALRLKPINEKNFPLFDTMIEKSIDTKSGMIFPEVYIDEGLKLRLYVHSGIGGATFVVDPLSLMYGRDRRKMQETYINIAPRDMSFWNKCVSKFITHLLQLSLYESFMEQWSFNRLDFSITIKLHKDFDIVQFLDYLKRIPKAYNFESEEFVSIGQSEHMVAFSNKSNTQTFVIYDKAYEQAVRHNNPIFNDGKYLRMEYSVKWSKLKQLIRSYHQKGFIPPQTNSIASQLFFLSNLSPIIFIDTINRIFPNGDIVTRKRFLTEVRNLSCRDTTKNQIVDLIERFSRSKTAKDSLEIVNTYKSVYGKSKYRYLMSMLNRSDIAPIYIRRSHEDATRCIPSVMHLYKCSLMAVNSEMIHLEKLYEDGIRYIESLKYPSVDTSDDEFIDSSI